MLKTKCYNLCVGALVLGLVLIGSAHKVSTSFNKYSYDAKEYKLDSKTKAAHIVNYNGLKIVKPLNEEINKQVFSYKYVEDTFNTIPKILTENIKEIQLLDYSSTLDKYWTKNYGMKNFKSYASGGNGYIYIYANAYLGITRNKRILRSTLIHESAHNLDVKISSQKKRFSNSTEWLTIMSKDLNKDHGRYCSEYAKSSNSSVEDFAEAVTQYVINKDKFTKEYPNRSNKIQKLFNK